MALCGNYALNLAFLRFCVMATKPISVSTLSNPLSVKRLKPIFCFIFPKKPSRMEQSIFTYISKNVFQYEALHDPQFKADKELP